MIALLEARKAGILTRGNLVPNIIAGIIVGVVSLPLSMAFAIASGVSPDQGLTTAIIAGMIVTLLGGSRVQIAGPTGAFVVILLGILQQHGFAGLQLATVMAGVILIAMGFLRMGAVIRFIPAPVIAGFTAGIGVVIWVGQWPDFFGIAPAEGEHLYEKVPELLRELAHLHVATTLLAILGLFIAIFSARIPYLTRVPSPLVAMVVVTLIQAVFQFDGVATIDSKFGGISASMPSLSPPAFSVGTAIDLLGPAFTIAMLCAIESLLSAVVADGMIGTRHDSNQELIGQGVANVVVPFFGGIAATGAIARTATSIRNGGRTPVAGITSAITLVLIVLIFAPLAGAVPLAALAAILFVVSWNMADIRHFVRMVRRAPMADVAILITTFVLTIATDLVIAVNVGVLLATLHFLRRMSAAVEVTAAPVTTEGIAPDDVAIFAIEGPFFFAAVDSFEQALAHSHTEPKVLIVRLLRVPFMDITGIQALETMITGLRSNNVAVVMCEANQRVATKLRRAEITDYQGVWLVDELDDALAQARLLTAPAD
ncbi:MAG: STAS domain-containing protein [Thermomicrobiales bacterium]|nr:STAS domain-containing protein [Thermomicrobiales bacterium]